MRFIVGIFVGGESRRMGRPKGLLLAPESKQTLVERLYFEVKQAFPDVPCFLVGERPDYAHLALPVLPDEIAGNGPLGGLVALLAEAERRGVESALVLACDLPFVQAKIISRLATEAPDAVILCPYVDDCYQPLVARYSVKVLAPFREALGARRLALQRLLSEQGAERMMLSAAESESLKDWDTPEDAGLSKH